MSPHAALTLPDGQQLPGAGNTRQSFSLGISPGAAAALAVKKPAFPQRSRTNHLCTKQWIWARSN